MKLTLIICTYKRPQQVLKLLSSLNLQTRYPEEIIIVDGSPEEDTKEVVENFKNPKIKYILVSQDERGLTKQRNIGIREANGDIIAFLDDDTIPAPNYFEEILACFDRHPDAVGVGGQITNGVPWVKVKNPEISPSNKVFRWENWERDEDFRNQVRKVLGLISPLPPGWMPPSGHGRSSIYPPDGKDYQVEFLIGASFTWKKEIFADIKFSTYFFGYGLYEDLDFCIRASKQGQLYLCTKAQLEHHHAPSGRPNYFQYGLMVVRNGWFVWRRRWPNPPFSARLRWWEVTLLLASFRLLDPRNGGLVEALGRFWGMLTLISNKPAETLENL